MKKVAHLGTFLIVTLLVLTVASVCLTQVKADSFDSVTVTVQSIGSDTINPGGTAYYTVTIAGSGSAAVWELNIVSGSDLPSGYAAVFSTPIASNNGAAWTWTSTLSISTLPSTVPNTYSFTVHAYDNHDSNPSGDSATPTNLIVNPPGGVLPEYSLGALTSLSACFVGLVVFKKRSSLPHLNRL